MSKTYNIHGVDFPVDSTDGKPDLYSVVALLNTLASNARSCNGYANAERTVFVFDNGWSSEVDAKNFVAKVEAMGVWVTDIVTVDAGRCAWGDHRFTVTLVPQTKFCYENVFGK